MSALIQIFVWVIFLLMANLTGNIQAEIVKLDILEFCVMNVKLILEKFRIQFALVVKERNI